MAAAFTAGRLASPRGEDTLDDPAAVATTQVGTAVTATSTTTTTPVTTLPTDEAVTTLAGGPDLTTPGDSDTDAVMEVLSITDGDTIRVSLEGGAVEVVRLIGINAPEPGECHASQSAAALAVLVSGGRDVELVKDVSDRDQYGRLLRYLYVDGLFLNVELVRTGDAQSLHFPPDTSHEVDIDAAQLEAQAALAGIWNSEACGPGTGASVEIVGLAYDPPGDDNLALNNEWVEIKNSGDEPLDLSGWQIKDESASHRYTFASGTTLSPSGVLVIHTGCGTDELPHLYWCNAGSAIWNNSGDSVFVLDTLGNVVAFLSYDPSRPSD